jgi:hypothetical protein
MSVLDIGTLGGRIELDSRLEHTLDEAEEKVKHFGEHFLGEFDKISLGVGALSAAIVGFGATIVALGVSGSKIADVETGFDRLSGSAENAEEILKAMREGVRGTVNDLQLMTSANKLMSAGVTASAVDFGTMTAAANVLSRRGLGDLETIMSTIGRAEQTGRLQRLAYIGITGNMKIAEEQYANSLGTSFAALSQTQKVEAQRFALMQALNKVVADGGVQTLSFAQLVNQTSVAMANWVEELEKSIAKSPQVAAAFVAIRDALVKAFGGDSDQMLKTVVGWVNSFADAVKNYGPGIVEVFGRIVHSIEDIFLTVKEAWDSVPQWMRDIAKDAAFAGAAAYIAQKGFEALAGSLGKLGGEEGVSASAMVDELVKKGTDLAQIAGMLPGAGAKFASFNKQAYGTSPAEQRRAIDALKEMGEVGLTSGIKLAGAGAATATGFIAAATPIIATSLAIYGTTKAIEIGQAVWGYYRTGAEQAAMATARVKDETNVMTIAAQMNGKAFGTQAEAIAFLTTHVKDQASGAVMLRSEYEKLHPVIEDVAEAEHTAQENVKEAKKGVTEAEGAVKKYAEAQAIAAIGDVSTASAHAKLHDALLVLMGTTKEEVDQNLELAKGHLTAAQKAEIHATALEAFSTKVKSAANYVDVVSDSIKNMTGAQFLSAEVANKIEIPALEDKIHRHIALDEVEKNYLAVHAKMDVDETNRRVGMLATKGVTIEQIEAFKVLGLTEKQIADKLEVEPAILNKAKEGWIAHRQAVLDSSNAQLKFTTTDLQQTLKGIQDKYDAAMRGHTGQTAADVQYIADTKKRRDDDLKAALIDLSVLSKTSIQSLQETADKQKATYDFMAKNARAYSATALQAQKEVADEQAAAAKGVDASTFKTSIEGLTNLAAESKNKYEAMTESGLTFYKSVTLTAKQSMAEQNAALKGVGAEAFKSSKEGLASTATIAAEKYKEMEKSGLHWSTQAKAEMLSTVATAKEAFTGIGAAWHTSMGAIASQRELENEDSKESFRKRADDAKGAYDVMMEHYDDYGPALRRKITEDMRQSTWELENFATGGVEAFHKIKDGATTTTEATNAFRDSATGTWKSLEVVWPSIVAGADSGAQALKTIGDAGVKAGQDIVDAMGRATKAVQLANGDIVAKSDIDKGLVTGIFDAAGNDLTGVPIANERYSGQQYIDAATQLYTTASAVRSMVVAGAGSLEDIIAAGLAAFSGSRATVAKWVAMGGTAPKGFALGGTVMVGENGPERVALPSGSTVYPNDPGVSAGGGGGHVVNVAPGAVVVQYPIMRDKRAMDQLGSIAGDAIIQKLTTSGWRPPSGAVR